MALSDIHSLLYGDGARPFRGRVNAAVIKAATDIINEDAETANHANRIVWARDALSSMAAMEAAGQKMLMAVVGNATIQAAGVNAVDNDIQWVVNASIDTAFAAGV